MNEYEKARLETMLEQAMRLVVSIYHAYKPDGNYLCLTYLRDEEHETIAFNNAYWKSSAEDGEDGEDANYPIKVCKSEWYSDSKEDDAE